MYFLSRHTFLRGNVTIIIKGFRIEQEVCHVTVNAHWLIYKQLVQNIVLDGYIACMPSLFYFTVPSQEWKHRLNRVFNLWWRYTYRNSGN